MASSTRAPTSWRITCAALGVGPEVVVGLCVERSPAMLVGLLGILKAGGAYLPLDPGYPAERLAFMLADAGAPVLVTQSALLDRLPAHGARIVRLDADCARHRGAAHERPAARARPAQPRLRHLHLGLDRRAEGRRRHASRTSCACIGATEHCSASAQTTSGASFDSFASTARSGRFAGPLLHGGALGRRALCGQPLAAEFWRLIARSSVTVLQSDAVGFYQLMQATRTT